jgi:hypothetical protein
VVEFAVKQADPAVGRAAYRNRPGWRTVPTLGGVAADPDIAAIVRRHNDRPGTEPGVAVGTAGAKLVGKFDLGRTEEAAIGNLVCDAVRETLGADTGFGNRGNVRGGDMYEAGVAITRRHMLSKLSFGNETLRLDLAGCDLMAALENAVGRIEEKRCRSRRRRLRAAPAQQDGNPRVCRRTDGAPGHRLCCRPRGRRAAGRRKERAPPPARRRRGFSRILAPDG